MSFTFSKEELKIGERNTKALSYQTKIYNELQEQYAIHNTANKQGANKGENTSKSTVSGYHSYECLKHKCFYYHSATEISANDGMSHHICVSWSNSDDSWQFFKDGALVRSGKYSRKGYTIKGGETLTIGQEQDSFADDFDVDQSFQGSLTSVNLRSCVLRSETIKKMSK